VLATAIRHGQTVYDLEELELAYAPLGVVKTEYSTMIKWPRNKINRAPWNNQRALVKI